MDDPNKYGASIIERVREEKERDESMKRIEPVRISRIEPSSSPAKEIRSPGLNSRVKQSSG